ncbi:uncharacterized protein BDZ99DRAFT_34035 [Mytilinidion resinicola]|uniref:Type 1 phosphatases regulator n=1 Tax=Mytilinidion resinicola TaxID=574789 RepID=A0A6A6YMA4_9PEZI|nr:uncharacterized protein BDZ99DRAFT_34035 [Mytilinidion resinicola]KAF2809679.1 hypothetical protein BDZ99DRAFT_34035 [Mytilinidion resinicola]
MATSMAPAQNTGTPASSTVQTRPDPVLRLRLPAGTLRLRAEPAEERHIQWAEDVIDNEGMGKKSSKVCCQYHKPRPYDESSDESSSDSSDSDSDSEPDNSTARPVGGRRGGGRPQGRKPHDHHHDHDHDGEGSSGNPPKRSQAPSRKRAPNAYEKAPKKR